MHIVQALAALSVGGSELVAAELTEYLKRQGEQVTVLGAPGPLSRRVQEAGAQCLAWPVDRKRPATLAYVWRIRRWVLENQPDLIHVHSRLPALLINWALRGLPVPQRPVLVCSMHGHYSVSSYSAMMAKGDAVIAVSEAIQRYTLHNYPVEPERVHLIHGGASHQDFPFGYRPDAEWMAGVTREFPELEGKRWICLPGRLSRYKGHEEFIHLVSGLVADYPRLHGVVVGAGRSGSRYRDQLEGLAEREGVSGRITFTGVRHDIREWMAASELVLNLCNDPPEAFGRTILEALYLGRPVVAWNHGGVAEILSRMYPFGAVPPGNVGALRAQTSTFLHRAPPVDATDAFPLSESMGRTHELYQRLLGARAAKRGGES
jgi:glycosyltransferase involved in cell wall biosynthesis